MTRRRLTPSQRAAIIARQDGLCACCGKPLDGKPVEYDHEIPLCLGGADELHNLRAVTAACHLGKTAIDVGRKAKADRQRKHHETGRGRARKGRPLQSRGFDKSLSRKFDGTVVRREG